MIIGIDPQETMEYIPACDRESASPTVFVLGNITNAQKIAMIGELIGHDGKVDQRALQNRALEIFRLGTRKVKNFVLPGASVATDIDEITPDVIESIPFVVVCEVAVEIIRTNFDAERARKN